MEKTFFSQGIEIDDNERLKTENILSDVLKIESENALSFRTPCSCEWE